MEATKEYKDELEGKIPKTGKKRLFLTYILTGNTVSEHDMIAVVNSVLTDTLGSVSTFAALSYFIKCTLIFFISLSVFLSLFFFVYLQWPHQGRPTLLLNRFLFFNSILYLLFVPVE